MSEYQEEVLTNLLDLQAELRGDEPEPHDERPGEASLDPSATGEAMPETVAVTEGGVTVSSSSRPSTNGMGVNERLAALNDRLARLEYDLVGVTKRIERIEPEAEIESAGTDHDVDARWRSFLDLQKIVANRLDPH